MFLNSNGGSSACGHGWLLQVIEKIFSAERVVVLSIQREKPWSALCS
jgi:hypothetical protein